MFNPPEKLSDIDPRVHGITQDDIIKNRQAAMELVEECAKRGDPLCSKVLSLDKEAKAMGLNMTYAEELTEEDLL